MIEYERKFTVHRNLLPELDKPWIFVQVYLPSVDPAKERSVRLIPACNSSFLRVKDVGYGVRNKTSQQHTFADGRRLGQGPSVLKLRHWLRSPGRNWLVDYFPDEDRWQAETEFPDAETFWAGVARPPMFIAEDVTYNSDAYSRNYAKERSPEEFAALLNMASRDGCNDPYDPDAIFAE